MTEEYNLIERGRNFINNNMDILSNENELDNRKITDLLIDRFDSNYVGKRNAFNTEIWKIIFGLVYFEEHEYYEGEFDEQISIILHRENKYIKKHLCIIFFQHEEPSGEYDLRVIYEAPGNTPTQSLDIAKSYAMNNKSEMANRTRLSWVSNSEIDAFDTESPRPSKLDGNGVDKTVTIESVSRESKL